MSYGFVSSSCRSCAMPSTYPDVTRMDDPIFDPWSDGQPDPDPTPRQRTSRWRSAAGGQGVPRSRPVPAPPTVEPVAGALSITALNDSAVPIAALSPKQPIQALAPSGRASLLRGLLMPQLTSLIQRLEMARHETTVDDRLDQPTPSLRFRIRPWRGPFDERRSGDGAVLEILVDEGKAPTVTGRLWLDPLSATPTEQSHVAAANVTDPWVKRLLLDFVEKALRQA